MKYWNDNGNDFQEATLARVLFALCIIICFLTLSSLLSCKTLTPAEKARREYIKVVGKYKPLIVEPKRKMIY